MGRELENCQRQDCWILTVGLLRAYDRLARSSAIAGRAGRLGFCCLASGGPPDSLGRPRCQAIEPPFCRASGATPGDSRPASAPFCMPWRTKGYQRPMSGPPCLTAACVVDGRAASVESATTISGNERIMKRPPPGFSLLNPIRSRRGSRGISTPTLSITKKQLGFLGMAWFFESYIDTGCWVQIFTKAKTCLLVFLDHEDRDASLIYSLNHAPRLTSSKIPQRLHSLAGIGDSEFERYALVQGRGAKGSERFTCDLSRPL